MLFEEAGEYVPHSPSKTGMRFYQTLTPKMLCGSNFVTADKELTTLLIRAHKSLGLLEGMLWNAPEMNAFIHIQLLKEALCSCQIDDKDISFYDVLTCNSNNKYVSQVFDYKEAIVNCLGRNITNGLLCEMNKILLRNSSCESKGTFRKNQTFLKIKVNYNLNDYNPTAPEDMELILQDLENYIKTSDVTDVLIKTALIHYQFETIHPFEFGNGRTGRILAMLTLMKYGLLSKPILLLSQYLLEYKIEYFDRIKDIHLTGNFDQWVKFFIKIIILSAENTIKQLKAYRDLRNRNISNLKVLGKTTKNAIRIFEYIEGTPIVKVNAVSEKLNLSFNTAAKTIEYMVDSGMLTPMNDQSRHRSFIYEDYVRLFDTLVVTKKNVFRHIELG